MIKPPSSGNIFIIGCQYNNYLEVLGSTWKSVEVRGVRGSTWKYADVHGSLWKNSGFHGSIFFNYN